MNKQLIENHNSVVGDEDMVIHVGDFTLNSKETAGKYISHLKGKKHVFLKGSHDRWLNKESPQIFEIKIEGEYIVACHYALRVWPRSHYNSWNVYGHSHGGLFPEGKQHDVGVDNNNFFPVSFEQLRDIMCTRPDNFNLVKKRY